MHEKIEKTINVFLDTTVLLDSFGLLRKQKEMPAYLTDGSVKRYTFEKCVFEVYRAFRGMAGRKGTEGLGGWAQSNLTAPTDPFSLGKLISLVRSGNGDLNKLWARYQTSQILEAEGNLDERERFIELFVRSEDKEAAFAQLDEQRRLLVDRANFDRLCDDFSVLLTRYEITEMTYASVFDNARPAAFTSVHPGMLDGFVRDTLIPNEDFEIVFAALSLPADMFVTGDTNLITSAWSLGLNFPLGPSSFCKGENYAAVLHQIRLKKGIASDS